MEKFKILLIAILVIAIASCSKKGVLEKQGIKLVEGSDLHFIVNSGDNEYSFDLNMNGFEQEYISFDWDMAGMKSGSVSMNQKAVENATGLFNYFSGGYTQLEDQTSVWLSKKVFRELKSGKNITLDMGKGDVDIYSKVEMDTYDFEYGENGKVVFIPVMVVWDETYEKQIWIMDDPTNPLIVRMDIGFKVKLLSIAMD